MTEKEINAFLSSPYGKGLERAFWKTLAKVIEDAAKSIKGTRLRIRSADEVVSALVLKENVRRLIDKCDFTIAVITGKNPNVFWEIGYTEAQKKPVVYLVDEETEDLSSSPVLIIEALKCPYRNSDLVNMAQKKQVQEDMKMRLKSFLEQAVNAVKAAPQEPELNAFSSRKKCNLPDLIADAREKIYLITSNLIYFADFEDFTIERGDESRFAFDLPVERGVDIKILTMDPESPLVKYRAEQLTFEYDVGSYREELRESARALYQRYKENRNVSIRLYDDLPLQITLMIDNQVITSVMSRGSRSRENLHFLLDITLPGARNSFEKHFFEVSAGPCRHISTLKWAEQSK